MEAPEVRVVYGMTPSRQACRRRIDAREGRSERIGNMKKLTLLVVAIAMTLAISPVVSAQIYSFDFTNPTISVTGTFTVTGRIGTDPLDDNFATFTGTMTNTSGTPGGLSGAVTLIGLGTDTTAYADMLSPSGLFLVNNQFYPDGNATSGGVSGSAYLDYWGLLLTTTVSPADYPLGSTDEINIWSTSNGTYELEDEVNGSYVDTALYGSVSTPESGSLYMLLLCVLGLAGAFFFKARRLGLFLNA
jgi:hypothetical protein